MRDLTPDVLRLAKSGYPDVRTKALIALIRLDRAAAVATVEAFVTKGSAEDKRIYLSVTPHLDGGTNFPFLKTLVADGDERVRQVAVRVVGNFVEDERYLGLFRTILESGDVPDEMLKVIGEKRLTGFKEVLVRILGDPLQALWTRYHALAALAVFRDPLLFPMFAGCLKDENNLIKIGSLKALAAMGDKRAIPRIRPFTKSIDEDVKAAARDRAGASVPTRRIMLTNQEFILLRDFIYEKTGIYFAENKAYLLESRLANRIDEIGLSSFEEYHYYLKYGGLKTSQELISLFDLVTTNETSFFRNMPQLDAFTIIVQKSYMNGRKSGRPRAAYGAPAAPRAKSLTRWPYSCWRWPPGRAGPYPLPSTGRT